MPDEKSLSRRMISSSRVSKFLLRIRSAGHRDEQDSAEAETQSATVTDSATAHTLTKGMSALGRVIRHSWLYQWLTKEPEPEVIVIDLRETKTIGPLIIILDWVITTVETPVRDSRIARWTRRLRSRIREAPMRVAGTGMIGLGFGLGTVTLVTGAVSPARLGLIGLITLSGLVGLRDTRPWNELVESRTAELCKTVLEPPEPPDRAPRQNEPDTAKTETTDTPEDENSQ